MNWEEYRVDYFAFDIAICQTEIVVRAADRILHDFPSKLPHDWQGAIDRGTEAYRQAMKEAIDVLPEGGLLSTQKVDGQIAEHFEDDPSGILRPLLEVYMRAALLGLPFEDISFNRRVYSQQIVMIFAHLDAFIADTLRAICRVRPEVLKSSKKIDWSTVIGAGNWDRLLGELVERYVYEFGWVSVVKRIDKMQKELGLNIEVSPDILKVVELAEIVRNLVIHNGSRMSREFMEKLVLEVGAEVGEETIGNIMDFDADEVHQYSECARIIGGGIFSAVSVKFFGKDKSDLTAFQKETTL